MCYNLFKKNADIFNYKVYLSFHLLVQIPAYAFQKASSSKQNRSKNKKKTLNGEPFTEFACIYNSVAVCIRTLKINSKSTQASTFFNLNSHVIETFSFHTFVTKVKVTSIVIRQKLWGLNWQDQGCSCLWRLKKSLKLTMPNKNFNLKLHCCTL